MPFDPYLRGADQSFNPLARIFTGRSWVNAAGEKLPGGILASLLLETYLRKGPFAKQRTVRSDEMRPGLGAAAALRAEGVIDLADMARHDDPSFCIVSRDGIGVGVYSLNVGLFLAQEREGTRNEPTLASGDEERAMAGSCI